MSFLDNKKGTYKKPPWMNAKPNPNSAGRQIFLAIILAILAMILYY